MTDVGFEVPSIEPTTGKEAVCQSQRRQGLSRCPGSSRTGTLKPLRVGDTIWVSGQLSHDNEGNIVGPAPVDAQGRILDHGNMRIQMAQCYANARKVLAHYGATLDNVVEEVIYVTDMDTAFAVAARSGRKRTAGARSWRALSSSRRASHSRAS